MTMNGLDVYEILGHWTEMSSTDRQQFGNDASLWRDLRNQEIILWYEVEWSPAVGGATCQGIDNEQAPDHYRWRRFHLVPHGLR